MSDSLKQGQPGRMEAADIVRMSVLHPRFVREQRNERILSMRREGQSLQVIGERLGLTRTRVQQICRTEPCPDCGEAGLAEGE